jgi:hypothetical protein
MTREAVLLDDPHALAAIGRAGCGLLAKVHQEGRRHHIGGARDLMAAKGKNEQ